MVAGSAERRAEAALVAERVGKNSHRQNHDDMKAAKAAREDQHFMICQEHNKQSRMLKDVHIDNEEELFNVEHSEMGVDFSRYDNIPVEVKIQGAEGVSSEETKHQIIEGMESFATAAQKHQFPDWLRVNLMEKCKYDRPTPIQKYTVGISMQGSDLMSCAQTGSGKTCAFLIPVALNIQQTAADRRASPEAWQGPAKPLAVILAPTRELCTQIHFEARKITFQAGMRCVQCYGGVDAKPQLTELAANADLLIATPGRMKDFLERNVISLDLCRMLVLDEADRMLDMGFEPQISDIVEKRDMPGRDERQSMFFSATFPQEIRELAGRFLKQDYTFITVGRVGAAAETVEQHFIPVHTEEEKIEHLFAEIGRSESGDDKVLVFVNQKKTCAYLAQQLHDAGEARATSIHGDLDQQQREKALEFFKTGKKPVLLATEVAARGLDVPKVAKVINFDMPKAMDGYIHRIGRTGRVGNRGISVSFFVTHGNKDSDTMIAPDLVETLEQANLDVDQWLRDEKSKAGDMAHFRKAKGFGSGGGKKGGGGGKGGFGNGKGGFGGGNKDSSTAVENSEMAEGNSETEETACRRASSVTADRRAETCRTR
ncbi:unnamed protein product [Amoebophrya sp. A120]|nr:unnamed protein product [Amoebophrya sp. A120]|eukprot:GSA120T00025623001.1